MRKTEINEEDVLDTPEFNRFRLRWTKYLDEENRAWDGRKAMLELKVKDTDGCRALDFLHSRTDWRQGELLRRIFSEICAHKQEQNKLFIHELREHRDFLSRLALKLRKRAEYVNDPHLRRILTKVKLAVTSAAHEMSSLKVRKERESHSPLTVYEEFYSGHPRLPLVRRKIDLDARLQRQMAKMFVFYLKDYSLSHLAIARLIVLTYLVAGLAAPQGEEENLRIVGTGHVLNIRNVQDKIANLFTPPLGSKSTPKQTCLTKTAKTAKPGRLSGQPV